MPSQPTERVPLTNRPDREIREPRIEIVRTPKTGGLAGLCLSHDVAGAYTHWYRNRTRPCTRPACEACENKCPWRWHGYLAIMSTMTQNVVILEITTGPLDAIDAWMKAHGTLRGARISVTRVNKNPNARVKMTITPAAADQRTLPEAPPIAYHLAKIWDGGLASLERGADPGGVEQLNLELYTVQTNGQSPRQPSDD